MKLFSVLRVINTQKSRTVFVTVPHTEEFSPYIFFLRVIKFFSIFVPQRLTMAGAIHTIIYKDEL